MLTHLDSGNAATYRLRRADLLFETGESGPARREVIALLEQMPHYWDAQKLLLDIVEQSDTAKADAPEAAPPPATNGTGQP